MTTEPAHDPPGQLLTLEDAAARLGVGETTVRQLIAGGALPMVRIGRLVRVPASALRHYVDGLSAESGGRIGAQAAATKRGGNG